MLELAVMVRVTRQFSKSIFYSEFRGDLDFNALFYDFVSGLLQKKCPDTNIQY